jgi:hypothetical protein
MTTKTTPPLKLFNDRKIIRKKHYKGTSTVPEFLFSIL